MHKNATVAQWYKEHGRHQIFAGGKDAPLQSYDHSLQIRADDAARVRDRGDKPQTARDEKMARRKALREQAAVREYYEEMVLKKKKKNDLVTLNVG